MGYQGCIPAIFFLPVFLLAFATYNFLRADLCANVHRLQHWLVLEVLI